jgi:hypothetical protein
VDARELFHAELARRGAVYSVTGDGRWLVSLGPMQILVSLDNLDRQLTGDGADTERVAVFAGQVLDASHLSPVTADGLYWFAEPNDYLTAPEIRVPVSPRLDRVLVHVSGDGGLIRWVAHAHLDAVGLTQASADEHAWANLDKAMGAAQVTTGEIAGAAVAMLATDLPSKASLLLAPALRAKMEGVIGWPVLAVAPDRDFVYLWSASRRDLITGMGGVVCREHARAPYPLSTEIFQIGDSLHAIGAYAAESSPHPISRTVLR